MNLSYKLNNAIKCEYLKSNYNESMLGNRVINLV